MTTTPDNSAQHTTSQPSQPNVSQHLPNNPGVPNLTPCMTGQQVTDLLHARYTAKKYNPNLRVSDEDFAAIIDAGRLSPSSMGFEPWHFVHIKNRDLINDMLPYMWGGIGKVEDASHLVAFLRRNASQMEPHSSYLTHIHEDIQHYPQDGLDARMDRYRTFINDDQDFHTDREKNLWVDKQVYIALSNMLTMSAAMGIDSTPIEGFQKIPMQKLLTDRGVYDPEEFHLTVFACFGYSDAQHRAKTRRPVSEVLTIID